MVALNDAKASLVCTVKNEAATITEFLETIVAQSRLPDEAIIVDGGSTDGTREILERSSAAGLITLIAAPGSNIAEARNTAIAAASFDMIACTDGGCKLEKNWFERIIAPLNNSPDVDVVSGVYLPWTNSDFEEIASSITFPDIKGLREETFLPSGRSIAFRKVAWLRVGGYPENLATAEDTLFDLNLKKAGMKIVLARDAYVYWKVRSNLRGISMQYYRYSKGDGMALLFPKLYAARFATAAIVFGLLGYGFTSPILWPVDAFIVLLLASAAYLRRLRHPSFRRIAVAFAVAMTIELASLAGYVKGFATRITGCSHRLIRGGVQRSFETADSEIPLD